MQQIVMVGVKHTSMISGIRILKLHTEQVIGRQNTQVQLIIRHNKIHIQNILVGQIINIFIKQHKHSKIITNRSMAHENIIQMNKGHIQVNSTNADGRNSIDRQTNGEIIDHIHTGTIRNIGIINIQGQ